MAISDVSDQEIIDALNYWGTGCPTYVVRNVLARTHRNLQTSAVLRRLKKLEKAGKVHRVKSAYLVMIAWAVTITPGAS